MTATCVDDAINALAGLRAGLRPATAVLTGFAPRADVRCDLAPPQDVDGYRAFLGSIASAPACVACRPLAARLEEVARRELAWLERDGDSVLVDLLRDLASLEALGLASPRAGRLPALDAWRSDGGLSPGMRDALRGSNGPDAGGASPRELLGVLAGQPTEPAPRPESCPPETALRELDAAASVLGQATTLGSDCGDSGEAPSSSARDLATWARDRAGELLAAAGVGVPPVRLRSSAALIEALYVPGDYGGTVVLGRHFDALDAVIEHPRARAGGVLGMAHEALPGHALEFAALSPAGGVPLALRVLRRYERGEGWACLAELFAGELVGPAGRRRALENVARRAATVLLPTLGADGVRDAMTSRMPAPVADELLDDARRTRLAQDAYVRGLAWWREAVGLTYDSAPDWGAVLAVATRWQPFVLERPMDLNGTHREEDHVHDHTHR